MATRRTAYLHQSRPALGTGTNDQVTVDVYVLWPDGAEERANELLVEAVFSVAEQIKERAS